MKITTTGKSLKELLEIYGTGLGGFFPQEWYKNEAFFTEKPEAGTWDFNFERKLTNLTYKDQIKKIDKGYTPVHVAILCEAILIHFKKTGEKVLKYFYQRTSNLDSDGSRVSVGRVGADGLRVIDVWGAGTNDSLGVSSSRKLSLKTGKLDTSEPLNLEVLSNRLKTLEQSVKELVEWKSNPKKAL